MKSTEEQLRKRGKASSDDIEELSSLEVKKRILLLSHDKKCCSNQPEKRCGAGC